MKIKNYLHTFIDMLLPTARLSKTQKHTADQAYTGILWYVTTNRAGLTSIGLENLVVMVR